MEVTFDHWFLLPVGVAVAAIATSSGLEGSNFWIPIYLRWLALEPRLVFWMSLVTMVFGFGSAVARNLTAQTIDWALVRRFGLVAVPVSAASAAVAARAPQALLLAGFALFALFYGGALIAGALAARRTPGAGWTLPWLGAAAAGGASQGLIATGAGTFTVPSMLAQVRGHHARAVGASVLLVFGCTLTAVAFRLDRSLMAALTEQRDALAGMLAFAAPGVLIGGQLGPRLARRLPEAVLRPYVGGLLVLVAALVGTRVF